MTCEQNPDIASVSVQGPVAPEYSVIVPFFVKNFTMSLVDFVSTHRWNLFSSFSYARIHVFFGSHQIIIITFHFALSGIFLCAQS